MKVLRSISEKLPKSVKKVYLPNPNKKRVKYEKPSRLPAQPPRSPGFEIKKSPRFNEFNIQMLSKSLYEQIFKGLKPQKIDRTKIEHCRNNLTKHNINITDAIDTSNQLEDVDIKLPPIRGKNLEEHFYIIGEEQLQPYHELIVELLDDKIPEPPTTWIMQPGWTRYEPGKLPEIVDYPQEQALIFDVEVCMKSGKLPTIATACSRNAWYGWVSQSLIDGTSKAITSHQYTIDNLIPIESCNDNNEDLNDYMRKPKIIIGHNVSFDRARIKEQYWLKRTGTRFLDTMSLHVCVSGLTSYQRAILKSGQQLPEDQDWKQYSSLNSLDQVYKLYCNRTISKETRNLFIEGDLQEIQNNFQTVMKYCCNDVIATFEVFEKIFPLFSKRFPHPVTLAGMLELSTAYLPINTNWNRYLLNCEQTYEDLNIENKVLLTRRADQACQLLHNDQYKNDIWLWDQDWTVKSLNIKKITPKKLEEILLESEEVKERNPDEIDEEEERLLKKFQYLWKTRKFLSNINNFLPGYPNWYRKLCEKPDTNWIPGPNLISTSMQITPKLLSLTWEGYPLHYLKEKGWGFLVPFQENFDESRRIPLESLLKKCPLLSDKTGLASTPEDTQKISDLVQENLMRKEYYTRVKKDKTALYKGAGIWCNTILDDCCYFFKLPHKNGVSYNVGSPLAKDFLTKFAENVLAGDTDIAEKILKITRTLSYWRNNRDRIYDQLIVWLDDGYGAILPQVIVCGTLTRRAVEPTWMTASNAHHERVGSELRAMIQAPKGYNIVGADVDSQELWIASVIGDGHEAKSHGCTPLGWMTLSGNKAQSTDMHSVTAKAVGISRDHAKVLNYARIYGAGQNFAERLLKQFNPSLSETEARSKALKMFDLTKGKRIFHLKNDYLNEFTELVYSKWQAFEMAKTLNKSLDELFEKPKWIGGSESAMFNSLELIANKTEPKTPFLNCRLSRALEPQNTTINDRFLPTRINWVVQSGAVDFLHLMLICMNWLMKDKIRFCLSFHDEIRYLVPEQYKYQTALALHLTNLLTRSYCSIRLGIYDLPQSVAFFSSVEIDTVLRKESKLDCKTPSNPHGLDKGYNIPNGESLDIYEAIKKAKDCF